MFFSKMVQWFAYQQQYHGALMIPLKLQLKNFLSYGATVQTIDFSPYNLICLSGKNGHGKSALLDAITWAILVHQ